MLAESFMEFLSSWDYFTKASVFVAAHGLIVALALLWKRFRPKQELNLPTVGDPNAADFREAMEEGVRKYPESPYVLPSPTGRLVILPPTLIDELRLLPDTVLSSKEHHYRHFLGRWTTMGTHAPELHSALTIDLQRNVQRVLESAQVEVVYAFAQKIPPCPDWTPVPVFPTILSISALLIERTWVGLPLSRQDQWIKATTSYMTDVANAANAIRGWPKTVRPAVAPMLAEVQSLKNNRADVVRMIKPIIQEQLRALANGTAGDKDKNGSAGGGGKEAGGELFTWLMQRYKGAASPEKVARDELMATFSSLYTVTATLTQALFDLAAQPEYMEPLREELAEVLKSDPTLMQKTSLLKLKKMDSFIKESQRMNPLGLTTMMRVVMDPKGLKLSTGDVIPYGETICGPNHAINFSQSIYPDPHTFDGFRFSKLRTMPGNETKFQLISTSPESINFGHGINACPGRFFASVEIKVMLSYLLQRYDIKLRDGHPRPPNVYTGTVCLPDMKAEIMIKSKA